MKKLLSLILALVLLSTSTTIAIAAENTSDGYTRNEIMIADEEMEAANSEQKPEQNEVIDSSEITRDTGVTLPTTPANALALSGNTPYYYGTYTLSAGSAGRWNYNYRIL